MQSAIKKLDLLINNEKSGNDFKNYNLDDIKRLLKLFGDPHKKIKTIHIAGTNGKGSVAYMLNSILIASGEKTALYTSPHLIRINERIKINNKEIPSSILAKYSSELFKILAKNKHLRPTYFDALTLFAFRYFYDEKVDIAVIETGLGGRLDSTNVIHPEISIITDISMDHTHILGNTIEKITYEKSDIIKNKSIVVTSNQSKEILNILSRKSKKEKSELYIMNDDFCLKNTSSLKNKIKFDFILNLKHKKLAQNFIEINNIKLKSTGKFQLANASLAITASILPRKSGIVITERDICKGLSNLKIPGRMQTICKSPLIIFDPAHNPAALSTTIETLKENFPDKKYITIVSFMADKDYKSMFKILKKNFPENIIYYELKDSRGLSVTGPKSSGERAFYKQIIPADNIDDLKKIIDKISNDNSLIFITGSFRLFSIARKLSKAT